MADSWWSVEKNYGVNHAMKTLYTYIAQTQHTYVANYVQDFVPCEELFPLESATNSKATPMREMVIPV